MSARYSPFRWIGPLIVLLWLGVSGTVHAAPRAEAERAWRQVQSALARAPAAWAENPRPVFRWTRQQLDRHWDLEFAARRIAAERAERPPDEASVNRLASALREWLAASIASVVSHHLDMVRTQLAGAEGGLSIHQAHMVDGGRSAMLAAVMQLDAGRWPLSLHMRRDEAGGWRFYDAETGGFGFVQFLRATVSHQAPGGSADDAAQALFRDARRIRSQWPAED